MLQSGKVQNLIKDINWIISIFFKKDALDCGIENHIIRFEENRSSLSLELVENITNEATNKVEKVYYLTKTDLQICYETFEAIKLVARGIPKKPKSLIIEELPLKQEKKSLNISVKIDEYNLTLVTNSLFNKFYETYLTGVYDSKSRIYKFTAHLPNQILNRYELNDTFIIAGREYRINKIKTNLINGKTELELINKL